MSRLLLSRRWIIAVVALATIAGCGVRQDVVIDAAGGGTAVVRVQLSELILAYYDDLTAALTGVEGAPGVFDLPAIQVAFDERPGISLTELSSPSRGSLVLAVAFDDLAAALAQEGAADTVTFERSGSRRTLRIQVDRPLVDRFMRLAPTSGNDAVSFILPPDDPSITEEAYRGQLAWALEEYDEPAVVDRVLRSAAIEVVVTPEGRIVSQLGGEIVGDAVVFSIPVIELLTLGEPDVFQIVYDVR